MSQNTRLLPESVTEGSVLNRNYGYDGVGNVTSITDQLTGHPDSVGMTYDTANRLQTANAAGLWGNATFGYDDFDNLKTATIGAVTSTFTIDAATNRATAMVVGGQTTPLQYDGQGHLTHKGAQAFTFDRSDLLLGIAGVASYRYDADGRRTVIDSNGASRTAIYDHDGRLLMQLDPALPAGCTPANDRIFCNSFEKPAQNDSITRYAYLGRHLIGRDDPQGRRYLHTDALGSLVAETDANKTVTQRYHYMPYGAAFGTGPNGPGYAGSVMDPSGLVYMQARYYDPQLGRFLSTDPVDPDPMTGGNFNRYAYADANPYSKYDPDGRCASSDLPSATDDGLPCPGEASSSVLNDAFDTIDSTMAAMGPVGAEVSGVERAGVAAAEEVSEVTSRAIEGVAPAIGDLTASEIKAIQSVVNQAGRPLEVVGSAARGARTAASDIDYVVPPSSLKYFDGIESKLPGLDPIHGIIPGVGNPNIGPVLRFEPTIFP